VSWPQPARRAVGAPATDIHRERLTYLEPGRIPLGLVTVVGGYGGLGKSQYTGLLAAKLSRGEYGAPAASMIATAEDSPSTTVRPRLEAVQADLSLVHFLTIQSDDGLTDGIEIPGDLDSVAEEMQRADARLLIVDPLVAHLPTEIDSYKDQSVRRALAPLYRLAQDLDCAVIACIHLNKAQGMQPLQRLSGSGAFGNAARSVLLLDRDPDDPDGEQGRRRVLAHVKSNDGPEMPSLLYEIEPILLPATAEEPEVETSRLALIGESPHSGRALLASATGEERSARDEAKDFLRAELADGQRHPAEGLFRAARKIGISDRTLQRAREGIAETGKADFGGGWDWWLAKAPSEPRNPAWLPEGAPAQGVAPSAEVAPSAKSNGLLSDDQMSELGRLPLDEIRRRAEAGELG
jgi:hypothetical protein